MASTSIQTTIDAAKKRKLKIMSVSRTGHEMHPGADMCYAATGGFAYGENVSQKLFTRHIRTDCP
jgi:hypothetical protein